MRLPAAALLASILAMPIVQAAPLAPETLLTELDTDNFSGVRPSPDGALLALDLSRSNESLTFEYANQMFTGNGYPMWASLSIYRAELLDTLRQLSSTYRVASSKPAGDPDQSGGTFWSPDGGTSAVLRTKSQQTHQHGFYKLNLRDDKITRLGEYAAHIGRPLVGAVNDHKRITFLQSDAGHPSEVFSLDENSPAQVFDRVQTPLLIACGATDWVSTDCASTYNSLRRLGKPVQYLEYDGEGHVMEKPANIIDSWQRRLAWLDRYLGPTH